MLEPVGEVLGELGRLAGASGANSFVDRGELGPDDPTQPVAA
jgi:hypothetical protein